MVRQRNGRGKYSTFFTARALFCLEDGKECEVKRHKIDLNGGEILKVIVICKRFEAVSTVHMSWLVYRL